MSTIPHADLVDEPAFAQQLLDAYNNQTSFFFASPRQTMLGRGIREVLPASDEARDRRHLADQVNTLFERDRSAGMPPSPVVGAIPFDDTAAVRLFIPRDILQTGPLRFGDGAAPVEAAMNAQCGLRMVPEPAGYMNGVEQALQRIRSEEFLKVVLSRSLELSFHDHIDLRQLLRKLARHNQHGYTYAVDITAAQGLDKDVQAPLLETAPHRLIGASPELLVRRSGMEVIANPLAGSVPRCGDAGIERQRAEALLRSDKDRHEHAVVVDAVAEALRPYCSQLDVPAAPSIVHTDSMMHLSTQVRGVLDDPATCALTLAQALHPTPAVCGFPAACAHAAIRSIEPFERRYFTGMVGWVDARGDGEWAVTIRCAEAQGCRLRLYAGAGVVAGSTAAQELAETSAKFRTMLNAMGLDPQLEVAS